MVKIANRVSVVLFIILGGLFFINANGMGFRIPFEDSIVLGIQILLLIFLFLKANLRWQALFVALKAKNKFIYSKQGIQKLAVYEGIVLLFYTALALMLFFYEDNISFTLIILLANIIEGTTHIGINLLKPLYAIVLQKESITLISNEIYVVNWKQVKRIELKYNDVRFIDEFNFVRKIDADYLCTADRTPFLEEIKQAAKSKNIYCDINYKV